MIRPRNLVILAGAAAATVAVVRHGRGATRGHTVGGGILIGHAGVYDTLSRLLLGPLIDGIAADLLIVGVPKRGMVSRALFGTTAARLVRRTRVPVLAVPDPVSAIAADRSAAERLAA